MSEEYQISSSNLEHKLPKQHWLLRFSGFFILGLILIILLSLYKIQIPFFTNIELHPLKTQNTFKAIANKEDKWISQQETIKVQLENGAIVTFSVQHTQTVVENIELQLVASELTEPNRLFLQNEYISIGKVQTHTQPLILSLFVN